MRAGFTAMIEPLLRRQIFPSEELAARTLVQDYILRQITMLRRDVARLERKYGMRFDQFQEYLHTRSAMLESDQLTSHERRVLGEAIMREEEDWLVWKASQEMLESWLGLQREVTP